MQRINKSLMAILLLNASLVFACEEPDYEWARVLGSDKHTVEGPYSIEELEKGHMVEIRETKEVLPFGYINENWEQLKALYKPGDQFYFVHYQDGPLFFVEHHMLVRNGCIIGVLRGKISYCITKSSNGAPRYRASPV